LALWARSATAPIARALERTAGPFGRKDLENIELFFNLLRVL
jgi:hypothetical protein